jgi:hypothetical protein
MLVHVREHVGVDDLGKRLDQPVALVAGGKLDQIGDVGGVSGSTSSRAVRRRRIDARRAPRRRTRAAAGLPRPSRSRIGSGAARSAMCSLSLMPGSPRCPCPPPMTGLLWRTPPSFLNRVLHHRQNGASKMADADRLTFTLSSWRRRSSSSCAQTSPPATSSASRSSPRAVSKTGLRSTA